MKQILFIMIAIGMVITATLSGCKKQPLAQTSSQQIIGKWTMKTAIGSYTVMGNTTKDTTSFTNTDYFEFKADGTLAIVESNQSYDGTWAIANNKLYITNTDYVDYAAGFVIAKLTATDLQLYYTETNTTSSLEQTLNLSK